jgi:hypothetical protein
LRATARFRDRHQPPAVGWNVLAHSGVYVREKKLLSLGDAIRKMTLMPAQRLEARVPAMKKKGRIQPGADADLTVFDAATVKDRSTYEKGKVPSEGIRDVLVGGVFVVKDSRLVAGATPGKAVRAPADRCELSRCAVSYPGSWRRSPWWRRRRASGDPLVVAVSTGFQVELDGEARLLTCQVPSAAWVSSR